MTASAVPQRSLVAARDRVPAVGSWRLRVSFVVLVALFGFATWASVEHLGSSDGPAALDRIELPSVEGLESSAAQETLTALGLTVNVELAPAEGRAAGETIIQRPQAGAKVPQGDIVTLVVSDGQTGQPLPNLIGRPIGDVQATLTSTGATSVVVPVPSEVVGAGQVVGMVPAAGRRIVAGTAVTLSVSSGPAPRAVPEFVGKNIREVMLALGRGGFGIGTIARKVDPVQTEGTILAVDPPAGTPVARDYPVKLTVVGPPSTVRVPYLIGARQASAESALSSAGLAGLITVLVVAPGDPNDGRVTAQSVPGGAPVAPGTKVTVTVSSSGAPPPPTAPMIPVAPPTPG